MQRIAVSPSWLPETVFGENGHDVNAYVSMISVSLGCKRTCEFICEYDFNHLTAKTIGHLRSAEGDLEETVLRTSTTFGSLGLFLLSEINLLWVSFEAIASVPNQILKV